LADKKITQLSESSSLAQDTLFVVVTTPSATPITKKITAANIFANVSFITSTTTPATAVIKATATANANTTSASSIIAAGQFVTNALSTSANTPYQYGIYASSMLNAAGSNVKTEHAAAKFVLDVSNAAALITNTYGSIISVSNTGTRAAQPQAFISLAESTSSTTLSTKYVLDVGQAGLANVSANLSVASGNVDNILTRTTASASHKLRIKVNGVDYFILLANGAASGI